MFYIAAKVINLINGKVEFKRRRKKMIVDIGNNNTESLIIVTLNHIVVSN